ncbi:MAG: UdgX family uracil-DNA binding protein [Beijerinckiaceae bacterium]|nr:UdgX family uracil-DNA binding protein [Beijerinckiaceae bacterium]
MRAVALAGPADFAGWRDAARTMLAQNIEPKDIDWRVGGEPDLFGGVASEPALQAVAAPAQAFRVPRAFIELAEIVACHKDEGRFALLYRLLWRLRDDHDLLSRTTDDDVFRARAMAKTIRRERHKMEAFVRFREIADGDGPLFVAWFEPEHHVVELTAPFFARRFASMRWSILTPLVSAHWNTHELRMGPGASKADAPGGDAFEDHWRTYYASIFNPVRLKVGAMKSEMPVRYWKNLPESALIAPLVREAARREMQMIAAEPTPEPRRAQIILDRMKKDAAAKSLRGAGHNALAAVRADAMACRRCPLWEGATQTVFGEGPAKADFMFVGEQPGDQEDLAGRAFIGPAGKLLDQALEEAGIDRTRAYVTNAVKHFKNEPRGKRRLHKAPNAGEITACRWWLEKELPLVQPKLVVALGASALFSLTGVRAGLLKLRGTMVASPLAGEVFATVHPSSILRARDEREAAYSAFVKDLRKAAKAVA